MKKIFAIATALLLAFSLAGCTVMQGAQDVLNAVQNYEPAPEETPVPEVTPEPTEEPAEEAEVIEEEAEPAEEAADDWSLSILYTNDVHCATEGNLSYKSVSRLKTALTAAGANVLWADAGDVFQGALLGSSTKGQDILEILNAVGLDVMVPGNHDFDYTVEQLADLADQANFSVVCCNFDSVGECTFFEPYVIFDIDGVKVAVMGVTTPTTATESSPSYFQNEAGETVYDFLADGTGDALVERIGSTAATAREEGAEYVICLSHLGVNESASPYTSREIFARTEGIDCVIDGHSHTVIESEELLDAAGNSVLLTSTGTGLQTVGLLTLTRESVSATLIGDEEAEAVIDEKTASIEEFNAQVVAETEAELTITDPNDATVRRVRQQETNLGDLVADAMRAVYGSDVSVVNGGAVRVSLPAGEITVGDIIEVMPFNKTIIEHKVTGQQLLDFLEVAVSKLPDENGGFMQVSGISFSVDMTKASPVQWGEDGIVSGIEGDRRIRDVFVGFDPIDPEKEYTLATLRYCTVESGNGNNILADCEIVSEDGTLDYEAIIRYLTETLGRKVGVEYADPNGCGRILILQE